MQYQSTDATVETAPVELMRAVSNLLSNAIKYTDAGYVELRCEPVDDAVRVTVRDTGRGMDERELARCLHRHERGEASTGAGLGPDIVRTTCERWGYRFDIRSRTGTGTVATLTLPLPLRPAMPPTERGISPISEVDRPV